MGWEVYPEGIYELLMRIKKEYGNIKVLITENGAAFNDKVENGKVNDKLRIDFLTKYTKKVHLALKKGANVQGYFVWTLIDNFEWAEGYAKRFGLIHVDHNTQKRIVKESGKWYSKLIKAKK
jgi:beta-glucosidase